MCDRISTRQVAARHSTGIVTQSTAGKPHRLIALVFVAAAAVLVVAFVVSVVPRVRLIAPPATPIFEDRSGRFLSEQPLPDGRVGFWEVDSPPPARIVVCLLAIEDKRYYKHNGIDARSLVRAVYSSIFYGTIQGASTIPMQVARLQHPSRRTLWNKLIETAAAFCLVQRYGREALLAHYLRIVPQGNQIHGVAYAARRYFRKPLSDLSWAESALLASLPKAPGAMNLFRHNGFASAVARAQLVLGLLRDGGIVDTETHTESLRELSRIAVPAREIRSPHSYHYILRLFEVFEAQRRQTYLQPVRTSLDAGIQDELQKVAFAALGQYRGRGLGNLAVMVVERETCAVVGYIGSVDYTDQENAGGINFANTPRSSGSTLKPFLYALGLETRAFTPADILADLPLHIVDINGQYAHTYSNVDDEFLGPLLYRRALANSRNIPTIRVLERIGLTETYDFFGRLGLHDGRHSEMFYGYGIALGGLYITLEQLMTAYACLANEGMSHALAWLDGKTNGPGARMISEGSARQISMFLSDPLARLPTFPRLCALEFPFPVAIKTGTSQGYRDAWAVAYSGRYIVGVWLGHPDNDPMNHIGSTLASSVVQQVFLFLQPDQGRGIDIEPFPPPRDAVPVRVCTLSGQIGTQDCPTLLVEYFPEGREPHDLCTVHRKYAVDKRTGLPADDGTAADHVAIRTFTLLPPEYSAWAARHGYQQPPEPTVSGPLETSIRIVEPVTGSNLVVDPRTPRRYQSIPLRAEVTPLVPEIVWYVDGDEYRRVPYPYETRWPVAEGAHVFQARFARAEVYSDTVTINVGGS